MSTLFDVDEVPTGSSGDNEWYTPAYLIEAARKVMGSIYLDPASCAEANQTVRASRIYTKEQNGLSKPWAGPLWLNPPYGKIRNKSAIAFWISKLVSEHKAENVNQAILLTTCDSDNQWFQMLWDYPICFTDHNVHFAKPGPDGIIRKDLRHTQMFGTILVYLGPNTSAFVEHFTEFGPVVTPDGVHRRPAPVQQPTLWDKEITS